jgi:streptogramin lyase
MDLSPGTDAEIIAEYGPFTDAQRIHGLTFDGTRIWFAAGTHIQAVDPNTGEAKERLNVAARAGTAFDGRHLFQIVDERIEKLDPKSGTVLASFPVPGGKDASGLTWAEGKLWVGEYSQRKIHQIDPESGKVLRSIDTPRFVTGVTWLGDELWHGTQEDQRSELFRIDPSTGKPLEVVRMPTGTTVSGLESNGRDLFFCGGGASGKIRVVRRPKRARG